MKKMRLLAIVLCVVMAIGALVVFTGCGDSDRDFLDYLLSRIEQLEQEAAGRDVVIAEVEHMLLERDLYAAREQLRVINEQIALFEGDPGTSPNAILHHANVAVTTATAARDSIVAARDADPVFIAANIARTSINTQFIDRGYALGVPRATNAANNNRRNQLGDPSYAGSDAQMVALRTQLAQADAQLALVPSNAAVAQANAALNTATRQRNAHQRQFENLIEQRVAIQEQIYSLQIAVYGAGNVAYATMIINSLSRRIIRDGNYVIIHNRHYDIHASQWPTIAGPHMVRPSRAIRVPVNPQSVAVMCSSFLDIMIALGVQDRVVAFTHMAQPDFIEEYFPRTGATALPDLTSRTAPIEPHSPDFPTLLDLRPHLILSSSRARARPRNYFGRLSYIAPTIDLGSRTGVDIFIQDVIENVLVLGAIFDVQDVAFNEIVALVSRMREVYALASSLEANALIVQFAGMNAMSLFGAASRYSFVHRELGIVQAAPPMGASQAIANATYQHGTPAGAELLRYVNPDIIFVVDRYALNAHRHDADGNMIETPINVLEHELFSGMYAVANGHVHQLDPVNWYLVLCGFRSLMYQFDEIHNALLALQTARA